MAEVICWSAARADQLRQWLRAPEGIAVCGCRLDEQARTAAETATLLHPDEQSLFGRFTLAKRRREWLAGRLAAKAAAARWSLGQAHPHWPDWAVLADGHGRPVLAAAPAEGPRPQLSISHSGGEAVALAAGGPCGIDIQEIRPALLRVAGRFATPAETALLAAAFAAGDDGSGRLARLWAAKEAIRKTVAVPPLPGLLAMHLVAVEQLGRGDFLFLFEVDRSGRPALMRVVSLAPTEGAVTALTVSRGE